MTAAEIKYHVDDLSIQDKTTILVYATTAEEKGGRRMAGHADKARYCPYCGERIYEWRGEEHRSVCKECKAQFYVVEADESERKVDEEWLEDFLKRGMNIWSE